MSQSSGGWWALGSVGLLALAGASRRGSRATLRTRIPAGTRLYHGTQAPEEFEFPDGPAWFSDSEAVAGWFVRWNTWGPGEQERPRVLVYEVVDEISDLFWLRDRGDFPALARIVTNETGDDYDVVEALDQMSPREWGENLCWEGLNGWHSPRGYESPAGSDTLLCEPENWLRLVEVRVAPEPGTARGSAAHSSLERV